MTFTLRDGSVLEHETAQSPLRPGERGMHTNGAPTHWVRKLPGEWRQVPKRSEYWQTLTPKLLRLAEVCDTWAEFCWMLWGDEP